jgi:hypothetical protein
MKYENVCITILPDMLCRGLLIQMVIKQSDVLPVYLRWQRIVKRYPRTTIIGALILQ